MKLSERFDRRYQQAPTAVSPPPGAAQVSTGDGAVILAPAERRLVPRDGAAPPVPITAPLPVAEPSALLSPALAAAKGEIHAQLLSRRGC